MNKLEIFLMAIKALRSNKLRTGLTMVGIIIGIASVIGITSVGQGVQKSTEKQLQTLGTNNEKLQYLLIEGERKISYSLTQFF